MDPMDAIRQTFFQECEEGLGDLEAGLLSIEAGETDSETVNAVFRAVHSIKGGAGAFGLDALVRFAHVFETVLDKIRSGALAADAAIVVVMLRANDVLSDLVAAAKGGFEVDDQRVQDMVAELNSASGAEPEAAEDDDDGMDGLVFQPLRVGGPAADDLDDGGFTPMMAGLAPQADAAPDGVRWEIRFSPTSGLYAKANDPLLLFRELAALGELTATYDDGALPPLDALEPETAYLTWTLSLLTTASEAAIREVFDFVDGDCDLIVAREGAEAEAPVEGGGDIDIMALIARATGASETIAAAEPQAAAEPEFDISALLAAAGVQSEPSPSPAPEPAPAPAPVVSIAPPAAAKKEEAAPAASGAVATIRVDLDRVDRLIDLVGELVINQAMLSQQMTSAGLARGSAAVMALDDLEHLTRDIQDSVMAIRAQPVKSVFQRMPRLVRETAAMVGKQVRLVTEGENTEVDKTVIERLSEPLTHMIRNSIDHGIESAEKRLAAGKPAEGVVRLSALHRSGRIVIEIADDGAGINRPRVRQIAEEKGLISPEATMTDEEIDNLIFMAGFSTAATISDVSGRGVGMDVVKRSIQALGGRISIASRPGLGSTFTLSLPLTLAVLDGMVVTVAGQTLVAPLTAIVETLQPKASSISGVADGRVVNIRGAYIPLVDVGTALGYRAAPPEGSDCVALLVEAEDGSRSALIVDGILGQRQVVIKSLEANFQYIPGIAAATILGDGRVALILDVDAVVAKGRGAEAFAQPDTRLPLASAG